MQLSAQACPAQGTATKGWPGGGARKQGMEQHTAEIADLQDNKDEDAESCALQGKGSKGNQQHYGDKPDQRNQPEAKNCAAQETSRHGYHHLLQRPPDVG